MVTAKHKPAGPGRAAAIAFISCLAWTGPPAAAQSTPATTEPNTTQDKDAGVDETQIITPDSSERPAAENGDSTSTIPSVRAANSPQEQHRQQQQLLADLDGPPQAVWLDVGSQKVLGFWQPDLSGKPVGAVLMLHAEGQTPRWRSTLLRLHQYLPKHGWATFSVDLPTLPEPVVPPRPPTATEPVTPEGAAPEGVQQQDKVDETQVVHQGQVAQESAVDQPPPATVTQTEPTTAVSSVAEVRTEISGRITAATRYLNQQGQYNLVLLGEGGGAYWALMHLNDAEIPEAPTSADEKQKAVMDRAIRALVMVDIRIPTPLPGAQWLDDLKHPQVPTLDVFTDYELNARRAATVRQQASVAKGYKTYVQRRLPPQSGADPAAQETALTKTIRGFLQQHARGVELE